MVAEWAFHQRFVRIDKAFDDDLCIGGNFQIDRAAFDQRQARAVEEPGEEKFFNARRQRGGGRIREDRFPAEDDRQRHFFVTRFIEAEMPRAVMVHVPVHRAFARTEELNAIHADVSIAGLGVFRCECRRK